MAIECSGSVGIGTDPGTCFTVATDLPHWPEWARDLEEIHVLERNHLGLPSLAQMVADLFGKSFDATVALVYEPAGHQMAFTLVEARKVAALEGLLRFEPAPSGARMAFRLRMALVKPKAPRIEKMVSRKIDTALTRDLRRHIERTR